MNIFPRGAVFRLLSAAFPWLTIFTYVVCRYGRWNSLHYAKYNLTQWSLKKWIQCFSVCIYRNKRLINLWNTTYTMRGWSSSEGPLKVTSSNTSSRITSRRLPRTMSREPFSTWVFYHLICAHSFFSCLQIMLEKNPDPIFSVPSLQIFIHKNGILP